MCRRDDFRSEFRLQAVLTIHLLPVEDRVNAELPASES